MIARGGAPALVAWWISVAVVGTAGPVVRASKANIASVHIAAPESVVGYPQQKPQTVAARVQQAKAYAKQNRMVEAKEQLVIALREEPQNVQLLLMAAVVSQRLPQPDPEAALVFLTRAVEVAPESGDVHLQLGLVLLTLKRGGEAERGLRAAVKTADDSLTVLAAHLALMEFYRSSGENAKADLEYRQACALYPGLPADLTRQEIDLLMPPPVFVEDTELHPSLERRRAEAQRLIEKLKNEKQKQPRKK